MTLVVFPGAGTDASHPSLLAIERWVAPHPCIRADFPYRREGRRAPDRPPVLLAAVREVLAGVPGDEPLVIGGRSMGGRMCSMAVADGLPAAGLVLIAYPLHPPGKPERLRVEHFPRLEVPCLFISGTRDPFGTPAELEAHTATIPGPVTHVWLDGARHDLKGKDTDLAAIVTQWLR